MGGFIGLSGIADITAGEVDLASILLAVGGTGMVLATVYEAVRADGPTESVPDDRIVWAMTLLA